MRASSTTFDIRLLTFDIEVKMTRRKLLKSSLTALAASIALPSLAQVKPKEKENEAAKKIGIAAQPNQVRGDEGEPGPADDGEDDVDGSHREIRNSRQILS